MVAAPLHVGGCADERGHAVGRWPVQRLERRDERRDLLVPLEEGFARAGTEGEVELAKHHALHA
eukprot:scaffold114796_cov36-Phaeocystis_antarctica.AAC.1